MHQRFSPPSSPVCDELVDDNLSPTSLQPAVQLVHREREVLGAGGAMPQDVAIGPCCALGGRGGGGDTPR